MFGRNDDLHGYAGRPREARWLGWSLLDCSLISKCIPRTNVLHNKTDTGAIEICMAWALLTTACDAETSCFLAEIMERCVNIKVNDKAQAAECWAELSWSPWLMVALSWNQTPLISP